MNPYYARTAERAGHRCEYCHAPEAIFNFPFEVEHIIPVDRGGREEENNRALSCRSCNLFKSNQLDGIDSQTGKTVSLFNPRQNVWEQHFRVEMWFHSPENYSFTTYPREIVAGARKETVFARDHIILW